MDGGPFSGFIQMMAPPGMSVSMPDSVGSITRDYWYAANESFAAVGQRYADQMGLTFKVSGNQAIFSPRGAPVTASGAALGTVNATVGQNVLNWSLSPVYNRNDYLNFDAMYYDAQAAQHKVVSAPGAMTSSSLGSADGGTQAVLKDRFKQANQSNAQDQASSNAAQSGLMLGGGTLELDGCPEAVVGANCVVSGTRPGIDGSYLIYQVQHTFVRGKGFTTSLVVMQPQAMTDAQIDAIP